MKNSTSIKTAEQLFEIFANNQTIRINEIEVSSISTLLSITSTPEVERLRNLPIKEKEKEHYYSPNCGCSGTTLPMTGIIDNNSYIMDNLFERLLSTGSVVVTSEQLSEMVLLCDHHYLDFSFELEYAYNSVGRISVVVRVVLYDEEREHAQWLHYSLYQNGEY